MLVLRPGNEISSGADGLTLGQDGEKEIEEDDLHMQKVSFIVSRIYVRSGLDSDLHLQIHASRFVLCTPCF
jgi:hypothetical protein